MTLSPDDLNRLQQCGKAGFEAYINRFAAGGSGDFLSQGHPFQTGIVLGQPGIVSDRTTFRNLAADQIQELTFSRGILHCLDGWSYLARSLAACAAGDPHRVRHLAYYAELRAALAMLAVHGIGVFDRYSCVISAGGAVTHLDAQFGTHTDTWLILQAWAQNLAVRNNVAEAMTCFGHSISDCLAAFFASPGFNFVGQDLFGKLGFDLAQGSRDRNTRNSSSYGPTFLTNISVDPGREAEVITSFWRAFAPNEGDLDRHLLRIAIELEIAAVGGDPIHLREQQYQSLPDDVRRRISFDFLARRVEPDDHMIIQRALDISEPAPHLSVVCRSAILLRISTQLVASSFREVGIDFFNHMSFVWERVGHERGFWPPNAPPASLSDLWLPIELAVTDLEAALGGGFDRVSWIERPSSDLPRLTEAERAGLWALSA
ncbi:hypothetical protein [Mesorhizobium sp. 131-2-1]|uniref:hypothetical protein n=1 Tax=Mesorhizobium sp. 131-2-1 TaxID=2744518 RepID=UPI0019273DA8|nr:hypothetical protein [Mesorhizobium sp. 131-2-1]